MSANAFEATFALFVAVALVIFESLKSIVIEYGTWQVGRFIDWGFREQVTESSNSCITIDSCEQQSVQRIVSLFEREVVWFEQSSYVLHFVSPLIDHFFIIGFGAIVFVFICCRISVSQQQDHPSPVRALSVSDGSPGAPFKNPRPVLQRRRGTLA